MTLGPTTQPSLAHWWNSNRKPLNPTVVIFPNEKKEKLYLKNKKLIVIL